MEWGSEPCEVLCEQCCRQRDQGGHRCERGMCPWQVQEPHCGSRVENRMERGGSESQKPDHALHGPCRLQEGGWILFWAIGSHWQIFSRGAVWSQLCFKKLTLDIVHGDCRETVVKTRSITRRWKGLALVSFEGKFDLLMNWRENLRID